MNTFFANLKIQHKLLAIILFVSILTISTGFGIGIAIDIEESKRELIENMQITAALISEYCISPLTFMDKHGAEEILDKSKTISSLLNAHLFDENNRIFAEYNRFDLIPKPPRSTESFYFEDNFLHVYQPIFFNHSYYGVLYLRISVYPLHDKVIQQVERLSLILIALFFLAYFLAYYLQKFISKPILSLVEVSQKISSNADSSQQAKKFYEDETGQLADAFNAMLIQIRFRERAFFAETERLQVTLKSIGDAVITTDRLGIVEYLNPIAEKLTGWSDEEAYQHSIADVLNIISEVTYLPVENPVRKCLDTGKTVALSGHTILLDKEGGELTIEDSAAPIRNKNNDIIGAIMVFHDVSEARTMERELVAQTHDLIRARDEAEQANKAKSDFFARMSHELRTPLNAIIGYSELLQDDFEDENRDAEDVKRINKAGYHLLSLINDILDFSKISEGKLEIYPKKTAITSIIDNVLSIINPLINKKNNTLVIDCAENIQEIMVDAMRLQQILLNLLSNANKFSEESEIKLNIYSYHARLKYWINFEVIDQGIGIKKSHLNELFKAFSQVSNTSPGLQGGTGLGLVISKNLGQMMGGDVLVVSEYGKGSCFTLRLPMQGIVIEQPLF